MMLRLRLSALTIVAFTATGMQPNCDAFIGCSLTAFVPYYHREGEHRTKNDLLILLSRGASLRSKQPYLSVSTTSDTFSDLSNLPVRVSLPVIGEDGVYELNSHEEHAALMAFAADKLVILKVYAPWCRACKGLAPKFQQLVNDPKYNEDIPIIWASLSIQHSKAFVKSLGVIALPTVQFYVGGQLLETFGCGPSKFPMLKRKLIALINDHVDPITRELKRSSIEEAANLAELAAIRVKEEAASQQAHIVGAESTASTVTQEDRKMFMNIPFLKELSLADFDDVIDKAKLLTFEPGHIILRQGRPGHHFFVIKSGEVEISQPTGSEDPLISSGYLGTIINRLQVGDYFGERSLITGEPRMASVRATEQTTCWAFDKEDFPSSSVLSGKSRGLAKTSATLAQLNEKYGGDIIPQLQAIRKQLRDSSYANQVRGSVNNPQKIRGVDDDSEINEVEQDDVSVGEKLSSKEAGMFMNDATDSENIGMPSITDDDAIFSLLTRFQMIRHVRTCFEYIVSSNAQWGNPGVRKRRNLLVNRLLPAQVAEFTSTFNLIDANGDGTIELLELKRVLETISPKETDAEFLSKIMSKGSKVNGDTPQLGFEDYMGLMAEAEFYNLFRNIFASFDENNTGYVKVDDLDRVLCGVRDLISDDHKSVIDVDDKDMSIDYDQFARMLLGL